MNLRKVLQWLIALACTAAAVLNILYLTGAQPKSVNHRLRGHPGLLCAAMGCPPRRSCRQGRKRGG